MPTSTSSTPGVTTAGDELNAPHAAGRPRGASGRGDTYGSLRAAFLLALLSYIALMGAVRFVAPLVVVGVIAVVLVLAIGATALFAPGRGSEHAHRSGRLALFHVVDERLLDEEIAGADLVRATYLGASVRSCRFHSSSYDKLLFVSSVVQGTTFCDLTVERKLLIRPQRTLLPFLGVPSRRSEFRDNQVIRSAFGNFIVLGSLLDGTTFDRVRADDKLRLEGVRWSNVTIKSSVFQTVTFDDVVLEDGGVSQVRFASGQVRHLEGGHLHFGGVEFVGVIFDECALDRCEFDEVTFRACQFRLRRAGDEVRRTRFSACVFTRSRFLGCELGGVDFLHSQLDRPTLLGMRDSNWEDAQGLELELDFLQSLAR